MSLADALREFRQFSDGFLHGVELAIRRRRECVARDQREGGVAEALGIEGQLIRQPAELAMAGLQLGVLDGIDPLRETDHETIDRLDEIGNVFLGRTDGGLALGHLVRDIGRSPAELKIASGASTSRGGLAFAPFLAHASGMSTAPHCHACRGEIPLASGESIGYRETCTRCSADLHVCLNCAHHDPAAYNECRESNAERVRDRDRANRCDYFRVRLGGKEVPDERKKAMASLDALFKKS